MRPGERRESAFGLPNVAHSPGEVQGSSIILPGTVLQKEVVSKTVRLANTEADALSISEPCTAVDVYVDCRNVPIFSHGIFFVRIYAIQGTIRTVVGRGRFRNDALVLDYDRQKHVASARVAAGRFEITVTKDFLGVGDVTSIGEVEFPLSAIGYQATGSHPLAPPIHQLSQWAFPPAEELLHIGPGEVTSMNGTNSEPAGNPTRFIQLWDTPVAIGSPGAFLIEEITSQAQDFWSIDYGAFPLRFQQGLAIGNSTTSGFFTANPAAAGVHIHEAR